MHNETTIFLWTTVKCRQRRYLVMATLRDTRVKTVNKSSSGKLLSSSVHNDWMNHDPEALLWQDKSKSNFYKDSF